MGKSILVLEENSVVHGLVASALDLDGLTLHHEFNPSKYVERARVLQPDLILFSNADQGNHYAILKQLKTQAGLSSVPLVLLANSRDRVDPAVLKQLKVAGLVRKPFEASDLQQQVSKHLDLIELIGSAYDYQKSQSVRDEGLNPLTQIDVLDPEVPSLMQAGGKPPREMGASASGSRPGAPAPLAGLPRQEPAGGLPQDDLAVLDDGPVESFSAGSDDRILSEDVLLDEADLVPPLMGTPGTDTAPPFAEMTLEELGPEDLLDEESYEEASFAPTGVDQTIGRTESASSMPPAGERLDEIEIELASDDTTFLAQSPTERPVATRTTPSPGSTPVATPPTAPAAAFSQGVTPAAAGDIPPAVRRMMELKPVFSKSPESAALDADPLFEPVGSESGGEPDLMLGDEELDEAAILRAMETEEREQLAPLDGSDPDLIGLGSSEELDLDAVEAEADLAPLPAAPEQDDLDLTIDEDEEELILSSLDDETEPGDAPMELPAVETAPADLRRSPRETPSSAAVELTQEERSGLNEMLDMDQEVLAEDTFSATETRPETAPAGESAFAAAEAMARADQAEMDLLDELGPVDDGSETGSVSEEEKFVATTFQNMPSAPGFDDEGVLELPTEELLEVPVPQPGVSVWESGMGGSRSAAVPEQPVAAGTGSGEASGTSDAFEDAFAALKDEIESNPEGERLDDVLKLERLQDEVAKIEFTIPQHESALARGFPLYAVPDAIASRAAPSAAAPDRSTPPLGRGEDSVEAMRRIVGESRSGEARPQAGAVSAAVTGETTPRVALSGFGGAAGSGMDTLEGAGSLLDEATKARLSQVLDEIISISVRKAVREEMPRLMERMSRE